MADSIGGQTVQLIPFARPLVQRRNQIGLLLHQARLENIGEEVMVAVPSALVI